MLVMRLVPVAVLLLGLELGRKLVKNDLKQLLSPSFVICITIPHRNLNRIPADRVRETADVVVEGCSTSVKGFQVYS